MQALHFIQIIRSGRFQLYDYGSPAANAARYGSPRPPDIGSQYWRLAGLHIDLLAGAWQQCDVPLVRCSRCDVTVLRYSSIWRQPDIGSQHWRLLGLQLTHWQVRATA